MVPPTINYRVPDPEYDIDYATVGNRRQPVHTVMSNSFAFGGRIAALIVPRHTPKAQPSAPRSATRTREPRPCSSLNGLA